MPEAPEELLDARDLKCPEPLMLVRNRMRELEPGQCLRVLATDPTTTRDLSNFCRFMGHEMVLSDTESFTTTGQLVYLMRKDGASR